MLHSHTSYLVLQTGSRTLPSFLPVLCRRTWISFNLIPYKAALASHSLSYKRCHQNVIPACIYSPNFIIRMLQFEPQKANQIFDSPLYVRITTHKYNNPQRTTPFRKGSKLTSPSFHFQLFIRTPLPLLHTHT